MILPTETKDSQEKLAGQGGAGGTGPWPCSCWLGELKGIMPRSLEKEDNEHEVS